MEVSELNELTLLKEWISPCMEVLEIQKADSGVWDIALRDPLAS
ncbi:hypothetical protein [Emticicia sp. CRIBPO]|nr:hypothetical protein [Emticicia sp. CRIBPO]